MRKTPIMFLLLTASQFPAPAWAAECESLWRRSSERIQPAPPANSVGIVVMRDRGTLLYATGPLTYIRPPGLDPQIVEWLSPNDSPAAEIFSNATAPTGPGGSVARRLVTTTIAISMKPGSRPDRTQVKLTIGSRALANVGKHVSFEAVCSPSGILHGTYGDSEYLVHVDIGL